MQIRIDVCTRKELLKSFIWEPKPEELTPESWQLDMISAPCTVQMPGLSQDLLIIMRRIL